MPTLAGEELQVEGFAVDQPGPTTFELLMGRPMARYTVHVTWD